MSDFQPISCVSHERLEFSVLRRIPLMLEYEGPNLLRERALPQDVLTRDGAEWLVFQREGGSRVEIRLDRIVSFSEIPS